MALKNQGLFQYFIYLVCLLLKITVKITPMAEVLGRFLTTILEFLIDIGNSVFDVILNIFIFRYTTMIKNDCKESDI